MESKNSEFPSDAVMSDEMQKDYANKVFAEIKRDHEKSNNMDSLIDTGTWW